MSSRIGPGWGEEHLQNVKEQDGDRSNSKLFAEQHTIAITRTIIA